MRARTSVFIAAAIAALVGAVQAAPAARPADPTRLLIANQRDHTLTSVDLATGQIAKTISVGINSHEVALSPDGKSAYVPIYGDSGVGRAGSDGQTIEIIDVATFARTGVIDLGKPMRPHLARFGPDGLLYVTTELDQSITIIDPKTNKAVGRIPTGADQTHMFAFSPDGSRIYTTNVAAGTVSVLDVKARSLITTLKVNESGAVQRITVSPDGATVFTHPQAAAGGGRAGATAGATPPPAPGGKIVMIDAKTNTISGAIDIPSPVFASEPTPDGKYLIASSVRGNPGPLYVIDIARREVVKTLNTCNFPQTVVMSKSGNKAFIGCLNDGKLAVLDIPSLSLTPLIQLPVGIDGMAEY